MDQRDIVVNRFDAVRTRFIDFERVCSWSSATTRSRLPGRAVPAGDLALLHYVPEARVATVGAHFWWDWRNKMHDTSKANRSAFPAKSENKSETDVKIRRANALQLWVEFSARYSHRTARVPGHGRLGLSMMKQCH